MSEQPPSRLPQRDALALAALAVGVLGVLLEAVLGLAQPFAFRTGGTGGAMAIGVASLAVRVLFGLTALALGLVALLRRRPRSPVAAAGVALAGALLLGVVVAAVNQLAYAVL